MENIQTKLLFKDYLKYYDKGRQAGAIVIASIWIFMAAVALCAGISTVVSPIFDPAWGRVFIEYIIEGCILIPSGMFIIFKKSRIATILFLSVFIYEYAILGYFRAVISFISTIKGPHPNPFDMLWNAFWSSALLTVATVPIATIIIMTVMIFQLHSNYKRTLKKEGTS